MNTDKVTRRSMFVDKWAVERRDGKDGKPPVFFGLACPYNSLSRPIYGQFIEQFKPGAFRSWLAGGHDIQCLLGHDRGKVLGRTSSKSLRMIDGDDGLWVECDILKVSYASDLEEYIRTGNIRGMSFEFRSITDDWGKQDGFTLRTVSEAELYEVSFVFEPFYEQSEAQLRSIDYQKALQSAKPAGTPILDSARMVFMEKFVD